MGGDLADKTSVTANLELRTYEFNHKGEQMVTTVNVINGNIPLKLGPLFLPALVDTGATISCVREGLLQKISKNCPLKILSVRYKVFLADNAICHVRKAAKISFRINKRHFSHQFAILPNLSQPFILGTDFLSKHKSSIHFDVDPTPENQPIRAINSFTIPAFSEIAVTAQVTCLYTVHKTQGITDNLQTHKNPRFLVQRSLVTPNEKDRHPIVLFNISSKPYKVKKGEILGLYCKPRIVPTAHQQIPTLDTSFSTMYDSDEETRYDGVNYDTDSDNDSIRQEEDLMVITTDNEEEKETKEELNTEEIDLNNDDKEKLKDLLTEFDDIFVGKDDQLGQTHLYTHKIDLKEDAKPCHFYPFRMAPQKAELFEEECQKLVKQGIIEETNTGPWASRSFLVEKKDGGHRLVTDFRYLNSQIINQALVSPRADDSLEMIGQLKPTVFSKMDAQQGFFQIPLHEEDRDKTAFLSRSKKYRYKSMPMGLSSSAQAFQALINIILQNLQYKCAIPYLDDILCLSPSTDQHFDDLRQVFLALRRGNLKLKKTKCQFFLKELDFLGMKVTPKGIKPSPDKVMAIKTFPAPTNIRQLRSFLGLAQFYRKFIEGFSQKAKPLFSLLKNDTKFNWTETCQKAFTDLKTAIYTDALLMYPNFTKEFHLTTDASGTAIGATLSQYDDCDILRPVAFTGRSLNEHEVNYSTTQRELLAAVYAVEYFRHYLEGSHFHLYTDHQALIQLLTKPDNKHLWARWALRIQQYDFTIHHLKGKLNVPADILSRRSYPASKTEITDAPPQPSKIKVARRVSFKDEVHTQYFDTEESPNTINKPPPPSILKTTSTHHFYCPCEDKPKDDKTTNTTETEKKETVTALTKKRKTQKRKTKKTKKSFPLVRITNDKPSDKPTTTKIDSKITKERNMTDLLIQQTQDIMDTFTSTDNALLTATSLKREQNNSPTCKPLIDFLTTNKLPEENQEAKKITKDAEDHTMLNGILTHINSILWKQHKEISFQPVIPETLRPHILKLFHDIPMAGHTGTQKMLSAMIPKVFWKGMTTDVQKYTSTCNLCLKAKKMNATPKQPMTKHQDCSYPFEFIHIDALGPLPETDNGNKHIQIVVDRFTKYCIAYATPALDADRTANDFVDNVCMKHGIPNILQSDNGPCYKGKKFEDMCQTYGINHVTSSPYRPKSNGQVERYVQTIATGLRTFCMDNQSAWDKTLPHIVFAINSTCSNTTGFSPFFLLHGRQPNTIADNKLKIPKESQSITAYITDMIKTLDITHKTAHDNIQDKTDKMKAQHDRKAKPTAIKRESLVYVKVPRLLDRDNCLKLQQVYTGPYIVCSFNSPNTVLLKSLQTLKLAPKPVHVDRLKLVTHVRKNNFLKRLINHNEVIFKQLWKLDKGSIIPTKPLLATTRNIESRPSHSKVQKCSLKNGM